MTKKVIAICCSDLHMTLRPPIARSEEPNWQDCMGRVLEEVGDLASLHGAQVLFGGDLLDTWNVQPELLNFAMKHMPKQKHTTNHIYCVPGQHDLPNHRLDQVHRSGYQTLHSAGCIRHISKWECLSGCMLDIVPVAWNQSIPPAPSDSSVLLCHKYVWTKSHKYHGAASDDELGALKDVLKGYRAAIFGDNHKGFIAKSGDCNVCNCGTMMRRKIDEADYKPMVGLLMDDFTFEPHFLDISKDLLRSPPKKSDIVVPDLSDVLESLSNAEQKVLDYGRAVRDCISKGDVGPEVAKLLLESIGE